MCHGLASEVTMEMRGAYEGAHVSTWFLLQVFFFLPNTWTKSLSWIRLRCTFTIQVWDRKRKANVIVLV